MPSSGDRYRQGPPRAPATTRSRYPGNRARSPARNATAAIVSPLFSAPDVGSTLESTTNKPSTSWDLQSAFTTDVAASRPIRAVPVL